MNAPLRTLSLFAGIGGFDLGLERTGGFKTVAFCEIEPFAVRVLKKHWPEVPVYGDVRELTAERIRADGIAVDVLCGGFPCQDVSNANRNGSSGLNGARSGLWAEYARLIGELRPAFVIVENVSALLHRGLGRVLGDLASLGYDAEWSCVSAARLGAAHVRDRFWLVAYPMREPVEGREPQEVLGIATLQRLIHGRGFTPFADLSSVREPGLSRSHNGLPDQVDRVKSLGNAVVPQIPELIGRAMLSAIAGEAQRGKTVKLCSTGTASTRAACGIAQHIAHTPLPISRTD